MMKRFLPLICVVLCLAIHPLQAQLAEHTWFVGGGADGVRTGLRFDYDTKEPSDFSGIRHPLYLQENNIIISNNATGDIVFYSDGQQVVDASHEVMPNGSGLSGTPSNMYGTSVVYDPAGCRTYYLFYGEDQTASPPRKLFYSKINLDLPGNGSTDAPLGDVVPEQKNVPLTSSDVNLAEGLFALPKNDGSKESWLFAGQRNGNKILQFNVTASGVSLFSTYDLAELYPGKIRANDPIFGVRFSYVNDTGGEGRLVIAVARKENNSQAPIGFVKFSRRTGRLLEAEPTLIADNTEWTYGLAFSPDGSKLYISDYFLKRLQQYDFATETLRTVATSPHEGRTGGLLLAPDGRIYWANRFSNFNNTRIPSLAVINRPNLSGSACEVEFDAYMFPTSNRPLLLGALPTFGSFPERVRAEAVAEALCGGDGGIASVLPSSSSGPFTYLWNTGETTDTIRDLSPGRYTVTITDRNGCQDAASVLIQNRNSLEPGKFQLVVNDVVSCEESTGRGSILITHPAIVFGEIYTVTYTYESNESVATDLIAGANGELWLQNLRMGSYSAIEVQSETGCAGLLSQTAIIGETRLLEAPDIEVQGGECEGSSFTLSVITQTGDRFRWIDPSGSTTDSSAIFVPTLTPKDEGLYRVVKIQGGCESPPDSFMLTLTTTTNGIGFDTIACTSPLVLDARVPYTALEWQDGAPSGPRMIDQNGVYRFNLITAEGCAVTDSIEVALFTPPSINLPSEVIASECATINLDPGIDRPEDYIIRWSGDYQVCLDCPIIQVFADREGNINLTLVDTVTGCETVDSVGIKLLANRDIYVPTAFSPNGDGINDGFTVYPRKPGITIISLDIYDRWGGKLFHRKGIPAGDPSVGWSGQSMNNQEVVLNNGVYAYTISLQLTNGEIAELSGLVHLVQ